LINPTGEEDPMKRSAFFVAFALASVALAQPGAVAPVEAGKPVVTSGYAIHHDTSPPLAEMALSTPLPTGLSAEIPIRIRPSTGQKAPPEGVVDENVQTDARPFFDAAPTPMVDVSVSALSDDLNASTIGTRIVPPDTNGDIGFNDAGDRIYVQYINLIWAVYGETGALLAGPFAGNTFWSGFGGPCQLNNDGDPVVLYDDDAGRWVFSQFSISEGIQCVAVSTTSDPLGPYHRYAFTVTPGGQNDYPKMGVWAEQAGTGIVGSQSAYTFTTRDFGGAGGSFSNAAGVMERDAMLTVAAAQFIKFSNPCTGTNCVEGQLPAHQAGPPPPFGTCPTFFTFVDDAYDDSPFATDGVRNHTLCVDWGNLGSSTYTENTFVAGANFDRFLGNGFSDCISPVAGGEVLDCLSLFTMFRAQYRWFDDSASVVINTTVDAGANRAGIHWGELRSADGQTAWGMFQEGTYAPADGIERWMGSIAQDGDRNIALGYSATSDSLMPSVRYTTRQTGDPLGTLPGGEEVCHDGTGAQISSANRWGDYSSMSVDPSDDCTFWFTTEYYETTGSFDFNTRICSFKFDDCGGGGGEPVTVTFESIAAEDGYVREMGENSDVGGIAVANGTGKLGLRLGDNRFDAQIKTVVSFDTSSIPAGSTIQSATLRLRRKRVINTNPFISFGTALVDVKTGGFSGNDALQASDFEAPADAVAVATMSSPAAFNDYSEGALSAAGLAAINTGGKTQLRVAFTLDDNDNGTLDLIGFRGGEAQFTHSRPLLVVTYVAP
jgi:hypothetical protein